jgi:hypothetical protein
MGAPKYGTSQFKKVLNKGCGGYWISTTDYHEFDCSHKYGWLCDECPINVEADRHKTDHSDTPCPNTQDIEVT